MKPSHVALFSMGGAIAGIIVVTAVAGRVALSRSDFELVEVARVAESAELTGFREIEVAGGLSVNLTRGDEWKVEVSDPENPENPIRIQVIGDRLRLGERSFRLGREDGRSFSVDIVMPELEELDLRGNTRVAIAGFRGDRLEIDVAGAVRIEGRDGQYEELELSVAGASAIDLRGVSVTNAEVDLKGASDVTLTMNGGVLSGFSAGAGSLRYFGSVSRESVSVAGVTRVVHGGK